MTQNFSTMNGPQLVAAYNAMVADADKRGQNTITNVKRFASPAVGVKRCETLQKLLREGLGPERAAKQVNGAGKKEVSTAEKKKENHPLRGGVAAAFKAKEGSKRERLLAALDENLGKQVSVKVLIKAVYGNGGSKAALLMVMKGLNATIAGGGVPYQIKHARESSETSYGLYRK